MNKNSLKTYHNVHEWAVDDVKRWLIEKGFEDHICELFVSHKIDGKTLLALREDDLRKNPLKLSCLGEIKKLHLNISHLQTINITFYSKLSNNALLDLNNINYLQLKEQLRKELQNANRPNNQKKVKQQNQEHKEHEENQQLQHNYLLRNLDRETDVSSVPEECVSELDENEFTIRKLLPRNGRYQQFKPEIWKAFVSMIYFFGVTWVTAVTMVIVHDRVPDMTKYPPLPGKLIQKILFI